MRINFVGGPWGGVEFDCEHLNRDAEMIARLYCPSGPTVTLSRDLKWAVDPPDDAIAAIAHGEFQAVLRSSRKLDGEPVLAGIAAVAKALSAEKVEWWPS